MTSESSNTAALVGELQSLTSRINGLPLNSNTADVCRRAADALSAQAKELEEARAMIDRLRLEAKVQSGAARCRKALAPSAVEVRPRSAAEYVIEDYLDAFHQANPSARSPTITARGAGWYGIKSSGSAYASPKRLRDIIEMTDRLRARAVLSTKEMGS